MAAGNAPDTAAELEAALLSTTLERHLDLRALVEGLAPAALEWVPAPGASSLAGVVRHILEVEGFVAACLLGEMTGYDGANGAQANVPGTADALTAALDILAERLEHGFDALERAGWGSLELDDGRSVAAMVVEELDHCAMHHGQAQLTRNLLEAAFPELAGEYVHWR